MKLLSLLFLSPTLFVNAFAPPPPLHTATPSSSALFLAPQKNDQALSSSNSWMASSVAAVICLAIAAGPAGAVSGGGLDYANLDITASPEFAHGNFKGKDFTQVIAKTTSFAGSNLQGCRFYKAYLVAADFTGADLRGASLEDTSMDDAILKNANAAGAYFSASILDVKSVEGADFTDAQIPLKTLPQLCMRDDLTGINPVTGVSTADSLMCP